LHAPLDSKIKHVLATYIIQFYRQLVHKELLNDAGPWQQIELSDSPLRHSALIEDLKPATKYAFRVVAEGPAGRSGPSPELTVRTEPQRPAGPPLNTAVRPVSSTELLVTWSPPLAELRHGDIQGYNVGYKETR
jgi:hypothetical protein